MITDPLNWDGKLTKGIWMKARKIREVRIISKAHLRKQEISELIKEGWEVLEYLSGEYGVMMVKYKEQ